jgi:hypothetical protein
MDNIIKLTAVFLGGILMIHPATAQENESGRKGALEMGYGFNALGPGKQMANLMTEYTSRSHITLEMDRFPNGMYTLCVDAEVLSHREWFLVTH